MLSAVCNSGPLIHLAQINLFKIFKQFEEIIIPKSVFEEVCVQGKPGENEIKSLKNLKIIKVKNKEIAYLKKKLYRWKLSLPEVEAIYLAKKLNKILLTDDLDAREAAESISVEVHGSVGVILRAFREKILTKDETINALNDLYEKSKLFVSRVIIEEAIKAVKKRI